MLLNELSTIEENNSRFSQQLAQQLTRQSARFEEPDDYPQPNAFIENLLFFFKVISQELRELFRPLHSEIGRQLPGDFKPNGMLLPRSTPQHRRFYRLLRERADRQEEKSHDAIRKQILDVFQGRVERVDSRGWAHVSLTDLAGETSQAEILESTLANQGIREGQRFKCEITSGPAGINMTFAAIPRRQLTESDRARIRAELRYDLPDELLAKVKEK